MELDAWAMVYLCLGLIGLLGIGFLDAIVYLCLWLSCAPSPDAFCANKAGADVEIFAQRTQVKRAIHTSKRPFTSNFRFLWGPIV